MGSTDTRQQSGIQRDIQNTIPQTIELAAKSYEPVRQRQIFGLTGQETGLMNAGIGDVNSALGTARQQGFGLNQPQQQYQTFLSGQMNQNANPYQNPAFLAMAEAINRQAQQSVNQGTDQNNANFVGLGQFGSSPLLNAQMNLRSQIADQVANTMAQQALSQYNSQVGNQFQAGQGLFNIGQYMQQLPFQQAQGMMGLTQGGMQLASMPRQIEQQRENEAIAFLERQRQAQLEPFQRLQSLIATTPTNQFYTEGPNFAESFGRQMALGGANLLLGGVGNVAGKYGQQKGWIN